MKDKTKLALALACVACGTATASSAQTWLSARGEFTSLFNRLEYDPGGSCYKPSRPYSNDQYARQRYLSDAENYLDCLERNANADMVYAQSVVEDGYEKAVEDFLREVEYGY